MKEIFKRGLNFVSNNLTIVSSIALIFIVVAALFLNAYFTIDRFQANLDKTLQSKAVLAENIINIAAINYFSDPAQLNELQKKLFEIQKNDPELKQISVFSINKENNTVTPIASTSTQEDIHVRTIVENANKFALSVDDAFAYITNENGIRFWNVVKAVKTSDGQAMGLLNIQMSLADSDALVNKTIMQVYAFSVGAVFIVLLLVINHIRLFGYEVKAKKLEEIDKMKDDFISMASHELKSPLTAIRGYSELLFDMLQTTQTDDAILQQKKYLKSIDVATDRLKALVEDLLDVSRIEQDRLPIVCSPLEVNEIIDGVLVELQVIADQKKLQLENELPQLAKINADPERIKQIMVNLISNAIKYTPHGSIKLQGKEDEQFVYITVADTGIGISPENMQKLFSKFFRVKNSQTVQISGTGLGLWIVKEVTQKMGGELLVESIEGVGSHFTLKFKKSK